MGIAKQQYDRPTFGPIEFYSNGKKSSFNFQNGKLIGEGISQAVKQQLNENFLEGNILIQTLSNENDIKEIFDFVSDRYNFFKSLSNRPKRVKYADSFYLNFKKVLAPYYQEIYQDYQNEIKDEFEIAGDEATRIQLESVLKELERENGPNIAEIENARFRKQITEGFLYGIPAIVCLVLIIKKLRS